MMDHVKEQIRNIRVAMTIMELNNELSEANKIILELGLETLERLVQEICDEESKKLQELKEELYTSELLLKERQRVLDAIPDCPIHGGNCVPHAIEWILERKKE